MKELVRQFTETWSANLELIRYSKNIFIVSNLQSKVGDLSRSKGLYAADGSAEVKPRREVAVVEDVPESEIASLPSATMATIAILVALCQPHHHAPHVAKKSPQKICAQQLSLHWWHNLKGG